MEFYLERLNQMDYKGQFNFINFYINKNYEASDNYKESLQSFENLNSTFKKFNFNPDIEFLKKLLHENKHLEKMLVTILNNYDFQNKKEEFVGIFSNEFLCCIIKAYIRNKSKKSKSPVQNAPLRDELNAYLADISKLPLLSRVEEEILARMVTNGDKDAKKMLIECNLKLVVSIANNINTNRLPLHDLIQEGSIGLMTAVDKYDVDKGYKFSTYAYYWIRRAIFNAIITKGRLIKLPFGVDQKIGLYLKIVNRLKDLTNDELSLGEIAKEMNISVDALESLIKYYKFNYVFSLNHLITVDDETKEAKIENVIKTAVESPEEEVVRSSLKDALNLVLEACDLTEQEKTVITLRYGLKDNKVRTLKEVGNMINLTRERIRQIEAKALKKIRTFKNTEELIWYTMYPSKSLDNLNQYKELYADGVTITKVFLNGRFTKLKIT